MALSFMTVLALVVAVCVMPEEGMGLPVLGSPESHSTAAPHKIRAKRCSCSNWLDKECIYFCHLDIIWINTPSKTLPYGMGSPLSRRRRSTDRCECASSTDRSCAGFCYSRTKDAVVSLKRPDCQKINVPVEHPNLLTFFRQVIRVNARAAEQDRGRRKTPLNAAQLYST